jgi:hypothetical protein
MEVGWNMDKEIFEKLLHQKVQIVNDENFTIDGRIEAVFNNAIALFTDGKVKYLSFDRIKEVRPLGGHYGN